MRVADGDEMRAVPIVAITGDVVGHRGKGLHRHSGKTGTSLRIVPLRRFVVDMLTKREQHGPEVPVAVTELHGRPVIVSANFVEIRTWDLAARFG